MMPTMLTFIAMAAPQDGSQGQQSPAFMIGWIVLMVAIFYFMLIRPQQRREKDRQALIAAVKTGDRVVFSGGMLGVVANVKEKTLTVKISENVKVEILRASVTQVLDKGSSPAEDA